MNAIVTTLTGRLQAVLHATIHLITGICLIISHCGNSAWHATLASVNSLSTRLH